MTRWKAILGVVAVFLLGALAGGLVTIGVVGHRFRNRSDMIVRRLSWRLHLSAAQRDQLRGIVTNAQQQIHQQVQPQIQVILAQSEDKVRAILQPDQLEEFNKIAAERKARRAKIQPPSQPPAPPPQN